jgi:hypothetical protein
MSIGIGKKEFLHHNVSAESTASEPFSLRNFGTFLNRYRAQSGVTVLFLLLGYGQKMFSNTFSIDTQSSISDNYLLYRSWYELERFGLVLFKRFAGVWQYDNALASYLMVVCFGISSFIWAYLFYGAMRDKSRFHLIAFTVPYLTAPIFAEMLGFLLLGPEISIASSLVAISLMLWSNAMDRNVKFHLDLPCIIQLVVALMLATMAFSMYLAMVTLFVAGVAMYYFLRYGEKNKDEKVSRGFIAIGVSIVLFTLAYLGYSIANTLVMKHANVSRDSYISNQSHWGKFELPEIWTDISNHFFKMYSGAGIFYSTFFTIFGVLFIVAALVLAVRGQLRVFAFVDALLIMISPMMMTVILGADPSVRTEMTYPMAFSFVTMVLSMWCIQLEWQKILAWLIILAVGWTQGVTVNRIFYTESTVYAQDVLTAQEIKSRITQLGIGEDPSEPVVFVGNHYARCNKDCLSREDIGLTGRSILETGFSTTHGTFTKDEFIDATLGVRYKSPSAEQVRLADHLAASMPSWPYEGSVAAQDGIIVVKMS